MIAYQITTPVEGYSGLVAGVAFKDGRGRTDSIGAVAYFRRHGYGVEPLETAPKAAPAKNANKDAWVAYANTQDPGDHESMTKDQLIEQYGPKGDD